MLIRISGRRFPSGSPDRHKTERGARERVSGWLRHRRKRRVAEVADRHGEFGRQVDQGRVRALVLKWHDERKHHRSAVALVQEVDEGLIEREPAWAQARLELPLAFDISA